MREAQSLPLVRGCSTHHPTPNLSPKKIFDSFLNRKTTYDCYKTDHCDSRLLDAVPGHVGVGANTSRTQYRGFYTSGVSSHTGGIAAEAHFPQGNWAWGIELEATTGSDFRHWATAMLNAGLVVKWFVSLWGLGCWAFQGSGLRYF